jgi:CRISPR-associated helicase Cas3
MALAIWGHHGQLSSASATSAENRNVRLLDEGWQQLSALSMKASGLVLREFPTDRPFTLGDHMGKRLCEWKNSENGLPTGHQGLRFKALYCLMTAMLRNCDSAASQYAHGKASKEKPGGAFLSSPADTPNLHDWREVMKADILSGRPRNHLQQRANELGGICDLLNAGCGEGKTALALLEMQTLMQQSKINRVIFTLPTRFTSNNMHRDFRQSYHLPTDLVGLFHGESRAFLKNEIVDEDEERTNLIVQDQQMQDRVYHRPVTISTVDHLLLSLYHGYKYADWAFGNILQSLVVFDELHHYETLTVSAIKETLAILRLLRIPHLIMTATIPSTRIKALNDREPGEPPEKYKPIVSDGREEEPPNGMTERRIKEAFIFRKSPDHIVHTVREEYGTRYVVSKLLLDDLVLHKHLRQIVFVNQVEKAKAVARAAAGLELPVICYHAEFIGRDRSAKETQIREAFKSEQPCLLVATQIAELSLDISAERMHSEIAPLDDIIQRGGRLHRNGVVTSQGELTYEMIVHPLAFDDKADILPYVNLKKHLTEFPPNTPHLLQRSWDILTDGDAYRFDSVREWVNALYNQDQSLTHTHFHHAVYEDIVFGSSAQDRYSETGEEGDGQVVLRAKEYETFDVVPETFEHELSDNREANRAFLLKINQFKYWKSCNSDPSLIEEVIKSVRTFKRNSGVTEHENQSYFVLKRKYKDDYGVDFTNEPEYDLEAAEAEPVKIGSNFI